jgi:hypothetical protein
MSQPMTNPSSPYKALLDLYVNEKLSTEAFCRRYEDAYLSDRTMFEPELYEILNELFYDTDAWTSDPALIAERPSYYLNEVQFRQKAKLAAARLDDWLDREAAPS